MAVGRVIHSPCWATECPVGVEEGRVERAVIAGKHQLAACVAVDVGQAVFAVRAPVEIVIVNLPIREFSIEATESHPDTSNGTITAQYHSVVVCSIVIQDQIRAAVSVDIPIHHIRILIPTPVTPRTKGIIHFPVSAIRLTQRHSRAKSRLARGRIQLVIRCCSPVHRVKNHIQYPVAIDIHLRRLSQRLHAVAVAAPDQLTQRAIGIKEAGRHARITPGVNQFLFAIAVDIH